MFFTADMLPGMMGMPIFRIRSLAASLSPNNRMDCADGPMKVMWQDSQISAKCAFSDRNP